MKFKSVRTKLLASFATVAAVAALIGVFGMQQQSKIAETTTALKHDAYDPTVEQANVTNGLNETRLLILQHVNSTDAAQMADIEEQMAAIDAGIVDALDALKEAKLSAEVTKQLEAYDRDVRAYVEARNTKTLPASREGDKDAAKAFASGEVGEAFATASASSKTFYDSLVKMAADNVRDANDVASSAKTMTTTMMVVGAAVALGLGFVIARGVSRPLGQSVESLGALAHKDLTKRLEVSTHDETARMAESLNAAIENLSSALGTIGENSQNLAVAAEELSAVSTQIGANAEETSAQSSMVAAAGEQVSQSVATVAAAVEEMTSSVSEIAKSAADAAHVAAQAVELASVTNVSISKLDESSVEIGNVVKLITSIAEQTNLLALNATIEAARAGDAGKGFAVVASEVKELANETAKATEEISRRIEGIQGDTREAVDSIGKITEIIGQINEIQSVIAASVEEQAATTTEIGRNVAEAARGTAEISENITGVATAAQSTAEGVGSSQRAVEDLNRMAASLKDLVGQFQY